LTSLASENNAVQFGQGFPDFSPPDHVKKSLANVATSSNYLMYQYTRGFVSTVCAFHLVFFIKHAFD